MKILFQKETNFVEKPSYVSEENFSSWRYQTKCYARHIKDFIPKVEKYGMILVENEPLKRTVSIHTARQDLKYERIATPYTQYLINYSVVSPNNKFKKYVYHGIFQFGLHVYMSSSPLRRINQKVYPSFTDAHYNGSICTDHKDDWDKSFDSLKKLVDFSISSYWSLPIYFNEQKHLIVKNKDVDQICSKDFFKKFYLNKPESIPVFYSRSLRYIDENKEMFFRPIVENIARGKNDF
ncbi:MAG: hypothetical protein EKK64_04395 [Neisseriaceae bacterium]|nr:MAG: hypothetical protein EKK64_04395 [Neisseriaceae bacterium]